MLGEWLIESAQIIHLEIIISSVWGYIDVSKFN